MKNITLPYGKSQYKEIAENNYLYIDKTQYIEKLEEYTSDYLFFLRPRRFGKSLFTTMLSSYYDINEKDNFEKLFGSTYIGQNPTHERNSYYILNFNFSGLRTDTRESLEDSFYLAVMKGLDKFEDTYNIKLDYEKNTFVSSMFNSFLGKVESKISRPIYVIIDEYDHFANELLSFQPDLFPEIISKTGFVRKFYEVLKIGTESVIKRIFATGVSPITLDSLTSGFNIADDITRNEEFHEMMGFTHDEVFEIIDRTVDRNLSEEELSNLMTILQNNYNGYGFAEECETRLFNSDMILYYMKSFAKTGKSPKTIIDKNIASDYGKLGKLFELKNRNGNTEVLEQILNDEDLRCTLTESFSLEKRFTKDDFKSLLFYMGLLTIKEPILNRVILKVPNYAIRGLYFDYFSDKLVELTDYEIDITEIEDAISEIALDGNNKAIVKVVEKTLNKLSNRDYIGFDEKYVKLIFLSYLFLSKIYLVKSEYEVENGYIDIALLKQPNVNPNYFAIIEFKYITKKQYEEKGEAIVKEVFDEAVTQLNKYKTSKELKKISNLKKWAIIFVNDKCVINAEII